MSDKSRGLLLLLLVQVMEWEERYEECLMLLRNAQEEIRELEKTKTPRVIRHHCSSDSPYVPGDSLAVQLEDSVRRSLLSPGNSRFPRLVVLFFAKMRKKNMQDGDWGRF